MTRKNTMKKAFILFFFLSVFIVVMAATFTTTVDGSWSTNGTWAGGTKPSDWGNHTATVNHNVTVPGSIQGFTSIALNNGKNFTSGTAAVPQNLTLGSITTFTVNNGNIIVYGNLTLTNGTNLIINSGKLTVTGTLTLSGGNLTYNSTQEMTVGAITTSGSGGTINMNSGNLNVTNGIALNSGGIMNVSSGATVTAASYSSSNNNNAALNNSGSVTINGNVTAGGPINISGTGVMNVNGSVTLAGANSAVITNAGDLHVTGNVTIPSSAKMLTTPGGFTMVDGNVAVSSNENLVVGTSAAAPPSPYSDMVIKGNLISSSSGDVKIDRNGRLALFGDFTSSSGGGILFTVEDGGQTYIHGDISLTGGGGNSIINNNDDDPYGLYVNGTVSNTSGGSNTDSNLGDQQTMFDTNKSFYDWVAALPGSPVSVILPITLLYFNVTEDGSVVTLKWATSMEKDFDYFEVERAKGDLDFQSIGKLEGKGASELVTAYVYRDAFAGNGKNYYRLKSVDLDGTYTYSDVVVVTHHNSRADVSLYPNPVTSGVFTLQLNDALAMPVKMQLMDNVGKVILETDITAVETQVEVPGNTTPGNYIIRLISSSGQKCVRATIL